MLEDFVLSSCKMIVSEQEHLNTGICTLVMTETNPENIKMKKLNLILILALAVQSCAFKTQKALDPQKPEPVSKETEAQKPEPTFKDTLVFTSYNDDGDYMLLSARKGNELISFINEKNSDRSLLKGDVCEVIWKRDTIYISGDGEIPEIAEWIVQIKKLKDGRQSQFRSKYKKELKYHYHDKDYSSYGLDQLYLAAEYYIANTNNELLLSAIKNNEQLEYSIEDQIKNNTNYQVLGIGYTIDHHFTVMQWVYIDPATQTIYEYDLSKDRLQSFQ